MLLGLSNIRFISPESQYYSGFHMLPWYSTLIFGSLMIAVDLWIKRNPIIIKAVNLFLVVLALGMSLFYAQTTLFQKRDIQKDYYINYSGPTTLGEIVKIIKNPGDELFVSRDTWLVYWQSDAEHLPKLFGYYVWLSGVDKSREAIIKIFENNPPTFFYCENCIGSGLSKYTGKYQVVKKDGNKTDLYVLPARIKALTRLQHDQLSFHHVTFN